MDQENKLIRNIQKKQDRKAADILISRYYDEIYIYAFRQTGHKETAMDLTQDIFIAMLQSISHYDHKKAGFRTWLYRIATNKIIDFRRRDLSPTTFIDDLQIGDDFDFTKAWEDAELLDQIDRYLNRVDQMSQQIFRLHTYGGHHFNEIAAMLSLSESTVKTKYYRLSRLIRKEFAHEYSDAD